MDKVNKINRKKSLTREYQDTKFIFEKVFKVCTYTMHTNTWIVFWQKLTIRLDQNSLGLCLVLKVKSSTKSKILEDFLPILIKKCFPCKYYILYFEGQITLNFATEILNFFGNFLNFWNIYLHREKGVVICDNMSQGGSVCLFVT